MTLSGAPDRGRAIPVVHRSHGGFKDCGRDRVGKRGQSQLGGKDCLTPPDSKVVSRRWIRIHREQRRLAGISVANAQDDICRFDSSPVRGRARNDAVSRRIPPIGERQCRHRIPNVHHESTRVLVDQAAIQHSARSRRVLSLRRKWDRDTGQEQWCHPQAEQGGKANPRTVPGGGCHDAGQPAGAGPHWTGAASNRALNV